MKTKFTDPNGEFQSTHQLEPGTVTKDNLKELQMVSLVELKVKSDTTISLDEIEPIINVLNNK